MEIIKYDCLNYFKAAGEKSNQDSMNSTLKLGSSKYAEPLESKSDILEKTNNVEDFIPWSSLKFTNWLCVNWMSTNYRLKNILW